MCRRTAAAFKKLGMNFDQLARDAGLPSKSQLIEISNGVMEPSKRIIRYLLSKGFSAQWLFTGDGSAFWMDRAMQGESRKTIVTRIKGDLAETIKATRECRDRITDLNKTLKRLMS